MGSQSRARVRQRLTWRTVVNEYLRHAKLTSHIAQNTIFCDARLPDPTPNKLENYRTTRKKKVAGRIIVVTEEVD